jgi:hypothetical protein
MKQIDVEKAVGIAVDEGEKHNVHILYVILVESDKNIHVVFASVGVM